MGAANEEAGTKHKTLTLEEATARIACLESLVGMLMEGLKNHQHELHMYEASSCGCCEGRRNTHTTEAPLYLPEFPA